MKFGAFDGEVNDKYNGVGLMETHICDTGQFFSMEQRQLTDYSHMHKDTTCILPGNCVHFHVHFILLAECRM